MVKMENLTNDARETFEFFARKCFYLDQGTHLSRDPFVTYLCDELDYVCKNAGAKLVITMPPRHGKTTITSFLAAWYLGHYSSETVMVVTYNKDLAEKITYKIRKTMQTEFYKSSFATRVAPDRRRVDDFATKQGGGVFATSVNGAIAGHGAGLIIVDDALSLRDASNVEQISEVNRIFETEILSRLNFPKTGRVIVIGHRLHENDLPAFASTLGGYRKVELSLVAVRTKKYLLRTGQWLRKKGELLRAGSHTKRQIDKLKAQTLPSFDLFYQQGLGGKFRVVRASDFSTFSAQTLTPGPVVMSVDTAQKTGVHNSFTVMQVWAPRAKGHFLVYQLREQCGYQDCRKNFWKIFGKFRPSAVLIENKANGAALIDDVRGRLNSKLFAVDPGLRSKAERLGMHRGTIRKGLIHLPDDALWRQTFVAEVVEFPSQFTDQVDAMTQYLDFMLEKPNLSPPTKVGSGIGIALGTHPRTAVSSGANNSERSHIALTTSRWRQY